MCAICKRCRCYPTTKIKFDATRARLTAAPLMTITNYKSRIRAESQ